MKLFIFFDSLAYIYVFAQSYDEAKERIRQRYGIESIAAKYDRLFYRLKDDNKYKLELVDMLAVGNDVLSRNAIYKGVVTREAKTQWVVTHSKGYQTKFNKQTLKEVGDGEWNTLLLIDDKTKKQYHDYWEQQKRKQLINELKHVVEWDKFKTPFLEEVLNLLGNPLD